MNARPQFLPPDTPRWRRALAWLGIVAAGAILGLSILLISAFAVDKIFPPSVVAQVLPRAKASHPAPQP